MEPETEVDSNAMGPKCEMDKFYAALCYQKKKGNLAPLEAYSMLSDKAEKQNFLKQWLQDKKFSFVKVVESHATCSKSGSSTFQGWVSKYQVADYEKLPLDHPLLELKLADLPSRAHPIKTWADRGEKEYYYKSIAIKSESHQKQKEVAIQRQGNLTSAGWEGLSQGMDVGTEVPGDVPMRALEDGVPTVKKELLEDLGVIHKELLVKLKKLQKAMLEVESDALKCKAKLKERLNNKPYLAPMLEQLEKQWEIFQPAKDHIVKVIACLPDVCSQENNDQMQVALEEGQAHLDAFKNSAFKDAQAMLKV